ncbi:hypothetical protein WG70_04510 [Burkholderia oklahomensis EO147]|nr:hypothetical protein WG70_04510 [Burkholderia oklahomensis EO147]
MRCGDAGIATAFRCDCDEAVVAADVDRAKPVRSGAVAKRSAARDTRAVAIDRKRFGTIDDSFMHHLIEPEGAAR